MSCVQPTIDKINTTMIHCKHDGRKIKIGKVADNNDMGDHLNILCETLPFTPVDAHTFPSQNMFGSEESKEFICRRMKIGRHEVELFKDASHLNCPYCTLPSKSEVRCKGHVPHPIKFNDDRFYDPKELFPVSFFIKKDSLS